MTGKTGMLLAAAVIASLLPAVAAGAYAQAGPGGVVQAPYSIEDIAHSFAVMEDHVVYDSDKNIAFDTAGALLDASASQKDVDIALDFAAHSNSIVNAAMGPVAQANEAEGGNAELARAVRSLEEGRFRLLFADDAGPVTVNNALPGLAQPAMLLSPHEAPWVDTHAPRRGGQNPLTVCGGGGMSNPHPWGTPASYPPETERAFPSIRDGLSWARGQGYHQVPFYATHNLPWDYARVDTSAPGGCNSGPFREQAILVTTSLRFYTQHDEPNPELLSYVWPRLWWGAYTLWWHDTNGGTQS